jgi:hypothetical protein
MKYMNYACARGSKGIRLEVPEQWTKPREARQTETQRDIQHELEAVRGFSEEAQTRVGDKHTVELMSECTLCQF